VKRTALILLTAIYLLSCVGIGVNRFYCCGKLASVTLIYGAADNQAHKKADDNCCKNEKQSFKIKDTHVNASLFTLQVLSPVLLPAINHWIAVITVKELPSAIAYQANAPPGSTAIPIYTRNCIYRI
jgi:hypothetical protein